MRTKLDWSHGPIPCNNCGRPLRPMRAEGPQWDGTTPHFARGLCQRCYRAERDELDATEPAMPTTSAVTGEPLKRPKGARLHIEPRSHKASVYWPLDAGATPALEKRRATSWITDELNGFDYVRAGLVSYELHHGTRPYLTGVVTIRDPKVVIA